MSVRWLGWPCTPPPPTAVVEVVMVLCWMTCCWEHAGAPGLLAGLLSGPEDTSTPITEEGTTWACVCVCEKYVCEIGWMREKERERMFVYSKLVMVISNYGR